MNSKALLFAILVSAVLLFGCVDFAGSALNDSRGPVSPSNPSIASNIPLDNPANVKPGLACRRCAADGTCPANQTCISNCCRTITCTDSDGGINAYVAGTVTRTVQTQPPVMSTDTCYPDENTLLEYFCSTSLDINFTQISCPFGCFDGACSLCGNGVCDLNETAESCPKDCGQTGSQFTAWSPMDSTWTPNSQPHEFSLLLFKNELQDLYLSTDLIRYNGVDSTVTMQEAVGIKADAKFEAQWIDVADLVSYMPSELDFDYLVLLDEGIPRFESNGSTNDFVDDANDDIVVPLFGQKYVVDRVTNSGQTVNQMLLLKENGLSSFEMGDSFTVHGKNSLEGQTLTVKFDTIFSNGSYSASFSLHAYPDGNELDVQTVTQDNFVQFHGIGGDYLVKESLYLKTISVTDLNTLDGIVQLAIGDNVVLLVNNKGFPDQQPPFGPWDWKTTIALDSNSKKITSIEIGNSARVWNQTTNPIYAKNALWHDPTTAKFLEGTDDNREGFLTVDFEGFEPHINNFPVNFKQNKISYADPYAHNIPYYISLSSSSSGSSFQFDAKTWYYKSNTNDVNFVLTAANEYLNGVPAIFSSLVSQFEDNEVQKRIEINTVSYVCQINQPRTQLNCMGDGNIAFAKAPIPIATPSDYVGKIGNSINRSWYYDDANLSRPAKDLAYRLSPVILEGSDSRLYRYALFINESFSPSVWLLLDGSQVIPLQADKNVEFLGTDLSEDGNFNVGVDPEYYFPDSLAIGGNPADPTFYIGHLKVIDPLSQEKFSLFVDTQTNKLAQFPNNNLAGYAYSVQYNKEGSVLAWDWALRNDEPYLHVAYADSSTKVSLNTTTQDVEFVFPYTPRRVGLTVTHNPQ